MQEMDLSLQSMLTHLGGTGSSKIDIIARKSIDKREAKRKIKTSSAKNDFTICQRLQKQNNFHLITVHNTQQTHQKYIIEMEYLQYNLEQFLFQYQLNNQIKNQILLSIVKGLIELGICHRDLKLQNLMVKTLGSEVKCVHIDFQTCKEIVGETDSFVGTLFYQAPEVFKNQPYDDKADMFSLGVIIFQLYNGIIQIDNKKRMRLPGIGVAEATLPQYYQAIREGEFDFKKNVPKTIKTLIENLLVIDPAQRYSLKKVIEHLKNHFYQLFTSNTRKVDQQFESFFSYYTRFAEKEVKNNIIKKRYHLLKSFIREEFADFFQHMKKIDLESSAIQLLQFLYVCVLRVLEELRWLKEKVKLKDEIFQREFIHKEKTIEIRNFQEKLEKILKKFTNMQELEKKTQNSKFFQHRRLPPQVKEKLQKLGYVKFNEALQSLH